MHLGVRGSHPDMRRQADLQWATRGSWLAICLASVMGNSVFIMTHSLSAAWVLVALTLYMFAISLRRDAWLVLLPGLVPVVDMAPWSGMIYFTESDALVLATLSVFGLREAWRPSPKTWEPQARFFGPFQWILVGLMATSYVLSTAWAPLAGLGQDPNLIMGYDSPLNGARLSKGFLLAMLVLPMLSVAFRADPAGAPIRLAQGLLLGLLLVSLAAVWERLAFTGLSDFTTEYRTTALFWEMNVGGAQLDGWLSVCLPFLAWALLRNTSTPGLVGLAMVCVFAGYATFTTYSRGLYVGAALGSGMVLAHFLVRQPRAGPLGTSVTALLPMLALASVSGWLLAQVFQGGGYRGAGAFLGLGLAAYFIGPSMGIVRGRAWFLAVGLAIWASMLSLVLTIVVPKGAYLAYGLSVLTLASMWWGMWNRVHPWKLGAARFGGWLWLGFNAVLVNGFWGGPGAVEPALWAWLGALLPLLVASSRPELSWRVGLRGAIPLLFVAGMLATGVVIFNTYYASSRMQTIDRDFAEREMHWRRAVSLPNDDEKLLGIGTGNFSERYFWSVPDNGFRGRTRIESESGNHFVRLSGPSIQQGSGEYWRFVQRVDGDMQPPLVLKMRVRAPGAGARLHVDICRKHLLYPRDCISGTQKVPAGRNWSLLEMELSRKHPASNEGLLPGLTALSIVNPSPGQLLDIDDVSVVDSRGQELIANGGFSQAPQRWFFTSDRSHLPWHAKNMWLHYWVEHGWLGLVAFSSLSLAALYRVTLGRAAKHPLAPALAGGLLGTYMVGAFDSLVDAPRMTFLIFMVIFVALGVRNGSTAGVQADVGPWRR